MKISLTMTAVLALWRCWLRRAVRRLRRTIRRSPSSRRLPCTAEQTPLQKSIEAYLRNLYAFGPTCSLRCRRRRKPRSPGLLETSVSVKTGEGAEDAKFYVSKDGKYLIRGEVSELAKDPLAQNRAIDRHEGCAIVGRPEGYHYRWWSFRTSSARSAGACMT